MTDTIVTGSSCVTNVKELVWESCHVLCSAAGPLYSLATTYWCGNTLQMLPPALPLRSHQAGKTSRPPWTCDIAVDKAALMYGACSTSWIILFVPEIVSCAGGDLDTISFVQLVALKPSKRLLGLVKLNSLFLPCVDHSIHFSIPVPSSV